MSCRHDENFFASNGDAYLNLFLEASGDRSVQSGSASFLCCLRARVLGGIPMYNLDLQLEL